MRTSDGEVIEDGEASLFEGAPGTAEFVEFFDFPFEGGQPVFEGFELVDLVLEGVSVDRMHNQLAQVVAVGDGLPGLVGLEKKGEQVRQFGVLNVGVTTGADRRRVGRIRASSARVSVRE